MVIDNSKLLEQLLHMELQGLGEFFLKRLESRVGKTDPNVRKVEFYYRKKGDPRDYPETIPTTDKRKKVYLTNSTTENLCQRIFQISHEVVHVLADKEPDAYKDTTCLEEGIATMNARYESDALVPHYLDGYCERFDYVKCLQRVEKVGSREEIFDFVKNIRKHGFELSTVTPDFLLANCNDRLLAEDVSFLLEKFYDNPDAFKE